MIDPPLLLAFTAGMVASINPCGFALLPAYIGAFVAGDDVDDRIDRRIGRAVWVSLTVAAGFAALFTIAGTVLNVAASSLRERMPWLTILVGAVMIALGIAAAAGWKPRLPIAGGAISRRSDSAGMFLFGVSYALVSLSCTIGPFLAVSGFAMNQSAVSGILTYLAYATGMGSIILTVSVAAAVAHQSFVDVLRSTSRLAPRLAGFVLILSGTYAIWYGRYELLVYSGEQPDDVLIESGDRLRLRFVVMVNAVGAERIGLAIAAVTVVLFVGFRLRRSRASRVRSAESPDGAVSIREERMTR